MKKLFLFAFILYFIGVTFGFLLLAQKTEATQGHHGPYPTKTPTPTSTPTPSIDPCDVEEKFTEAYLYEFEPCVTPTPEVKQETPPSPFSDGKSDGRSDGRGGQRPGDPSCTIPFSAPWGVTFKRINSTTVQLAWVPSVDGPQHQSIVYGRKEGQELWGVNGLSGDTKEFTLNALPENEHIWVQIVNQKDSCSSRSAWIDP